jgi:hypothetical protein
MQNIDEHGRGERQYLNPGCRAAVWQRVSDALTWICGFLLVERPGRNVFEYL